MTQFSNTGLRRLLTLAAVIILLTMSLAGCATNKDGSETINNLPESSTTDSTETSTTPETTAPPETDPLPTTVWGTVNTDKLNVRTEPSTDSDSVGKLAVDTRIEILEQKTVGDVVWGHIEQGWVNMAYVTLDGETPVEATDPIVPEETTEPTTAPETTTSGSGTTGTITAEKLYIRKGAGSSYESVGTYKKGEQVQILETKNGWGRTDKGWISMKYVKTSGDTTSTGTTTTGTTTYTTGTGTISTGALNIREGAGSKYDSVGKYYKGDKVEILEVKNGWGRTDKGWISLKYVTMTGSTGTSTGSSTSTSSEVVTDSNTSALGYGVVTIGTLNVRCGPGTSYDKVDTVSVGERCAYYQKSGSWVRIKEGWVSTKYFYIEGTTGENAGSGTVTADDVNLRTGPGTGFDSKGKVNSGDKVEILTQVTVGKLTWGYTKNGWICMDYVKIG